MRDHDELLRRYLLDKLEDEERSLLEERLLREEDLLEMAEAIEADLLDDYDHDRLAPEEREQVAHRLASSPQGRLRLAVIQGLGTIAREEKKKENVVPFPPPARRELTRFERAAAMAAMLTFAVLSVWLATKTQAPVQPPLIAETPAPAVTAPAPPHRQVPPAATPVPPRDEIAESTPPETPAVQPAAPLVIQLALSTLRGEEEIPIVNVPPGTERVQLHLDLSADDKSYFASFEAAVRGPGWELPRKNVEPRRIGDKWTLVLDLDPKLPAGLYEVEAWEIPAEGEEESIIKELEITRNASAAAGIPD